VALGEQDAELRRDRDHQRAQGHRHRIQIDPEDEEHKARPARGRADSERPVWIVDAGPGGATTALTDTWALGALAPGRTRTFRWRLSPVAAGRYTLRYTVAAGLGGRARVHGASPVTGTFAVRISRKPAAARVDPVTGAVVRAG